MGREAVERLRADLVTTEGPWRAHRVVDHAGIAACVALQAESLVNRGVDPAPHLDGIARRLGAGAATDVLVTIEAGGACVGFLWTSLRTLRGPDGDRPVCHVDSIVLGQASRGRGLGGEVMTHLARAARDAGFVGVSLNSMADNPRVAGFYERLGYAVVGLDLEKELAGRAAPLDPGIRRHSYGSPAVPPERLPIDAAPLRDAFEPDEGTSVPTERFERDGLRVGLVGTALRRARDGTPIVVWDPFWVTPVGGPETVQGIVADREHAARENGAQRAYVTVWDPRLPTARVLQDLGYRVGRHKWWKGLGAS